ncbi:MAG: tail completion protein gp17 [Wolbachia sp.]
MKKIQAMYNSIYAALKADSGLRKYVTNIYDYLPKRVTIPYLRLRVVNYNNLHMLSNFATKARFSCDIYTYHIGSMFAIIRHINLVLKSIKGETILENDCTMDQHDEVLHSTINFDILIKGGDNEQVTAKN